MNTTSITTNAGAATQAQPLSRRKPAVQICIFCGDWVNLDEEGNTYANGTAAHEACHDSAEFERQNSGDFRD